MNMQNIDQDGFRLPEYIPLDLWHQYLQVLKQRNMTITNKRKAQWALSLSRLHHQQKDLQQIMQQSIVKRWLDFYSL